MQAGCFHPGMRHTLSRAHQLVARIAGYVSTIKYEHYIHPCLAYMTYLIIFNLGFVILDLLSMFCTQLFHFLHFTSCDGFDTISIFLQFMILEIHQLLVLLMQNMKLLFVLLYSLQESFLDPSIKTKASGYTSMTYLHHLYSGQLSIVLWLS